MTHPADDLLAAYVDGTLPQRDRGAVDAHLSTCARCTQDVARATTARSALRAIPEEAVPEDLSIPNVADAEEAAATARRRSTAPAWQRWAGPAAAVAAAALVVTLVLPKLGAGSDADLASGAGVNSPAGQVGIQEDATQVPLEIQDTDYDADTLSDVAGQTASRVVAPEATVGVPDASASGGPAPKVGTADAAAKATACIQTAFREVPGALVRLIRANFQGAPAYVGFYAEGPGAGQPADMLIVRVASVEGCAALSFAGHPL
jgi:hypothetical protein